MKGICISVLFLHARSQGRHRWLAWVRTTGSMWGSCPSSATDSWDFLFAETERGGSLTLHLSFSICKMVMIEPT